MISGSTSGSNSKSSISVWKKPLGPNLEDIFLKKDLEKAKCENENGKENENNKNKNKLLWYKNTIRGEATGDLKKKERYNNFICREDFVFDVNITCFPNYMHKSSLLIKKKFDVSDLILEVRDARLPFTSTNDYITEHLKKYKNKKKIILLNKVDLISKHVALKAQRLIEETTNSTCLLISSKYNKNISKIRDLCKEIPPRFKSFGIFALLIGLPNVGKSSIINSFKEVTYNLGKYGHKNNKISFEVNRKLVKTNILPGTTKTVDTYKVCNTPLLHFIDTPGIFLPKMENKEIALKLSAIGNTLEYKYDHMYVADYILYMLNKYKYYQYVKLLGLDAPSNDIRFISNVISTKLNMCRNYKYLDINGGCRYFIDLFRLGLLGQICLDTVPKREDFVTYFEFNSSEPPAVNVQRHPLPFRGVN